MNEIIYCGLKICTECSYFKFTEGSHASIVTNLEDYSIEVTFPKGIHSKELGDLLSIEVISDLLVIPTSGSAFHKINNIILSLNDLKFKKLIYEPHTIRMLLVDDYPSRVCQDYNFTTIIINSSDRSDPEFLEYVFTNLKYLKCMNSRSFNFSEYIPYNFPKIIIYDKSLNLTSDNGYIHKLRSNHNRYLIKAIDYEHKFLSDVTCILNKFGIQLARLNKEETLNNTSYVSYSINQTPIKYNHARYGYVQENILCHTLAIDFILSTPDMLIFFDFKNKYNNVDLLTNYSEFKTKDKYGDEWTAAVKWSGITEEFNHMYGQDNNANFANQCSFRAELYFYEVYDANYNYIEDIIFEIKHVGMWEDLEYVQNKEV